MTLNDLSQRVQKPNVSERMEDTKRLPCWYKCRRSVLSCRADPFSVSQLELGTEGVTLGTALGRGWSTASLLVRYLRGIKELTCPG